MWQTGLVLLIVAAVLIYLVRHYAKIYRGRASGCPSCGGCCTAGPEAGDMPCECTQGREFFEQGECFPNAENNEMGGTPEHTEHGK